MARKPYEEANISAVRPSPLVAFTSAPALTSADTVSTRPSAAAIINGVQPEPAEAAGPGSAPAPPEARPLRGTRQMRQTAPPVPWSIPHICLRFDHRPRHNLPLGALPVPGARGYVQPVFRRPGPVRPALGARAASG